MFIVSTGRGNMRMWGVILNDPYDPLVMPAR